MSNFDLDNITKDLTEWTSQLGYLTDSINIKTAGDETWIVLSVSAEKMTLAVESTNVILSQIDANYPQIENPAVIFKPKQKEERRVENTSRAGLNSREVESFVSLLETRSRTTEVIPSLKYVPNPHANIRSAMEPGHLFIYGRRGVGKTALALEARKNLEAEGYVTSWVNAQTIRNFDAGRAFLSVIDRLLSDLKARLFNSGSDLVAELNSLRERISKLVQPDVSIESEVPNVILETNRILRLILRPGILRAYIFIDDFYLLDRTLQPQLADYLFSSLRDVDGWLKFTSIEKITKPFDVNTRTGLEIGHDANKMTLDITLENTKAAQDFLESMIVGFIESAGISSLMSIASRQSLGRLVLASGGVPRDYMNLFSRAIKEARIDRAESAQRIGVQDVTKGAKNASQDKKQDLEQDIEKGDAQELIGFLDKLSGFVKGKEYTYFLVNKDQKSSSAYTVLMKLVDSRFVHLISESFSDKHRTGVRYEAYTLDLSEFADTRLQRKLNILDIVNGKWNGRLTGNQREIVELTTEQLRTRLRRAPEVDLTNLS